ncbi:EamA family transporter [Streptomyces sp. NRRL F-4489]|uniref:EamA family transporter n=1 Tax=Streptomyces sp. NRRL F-4489 TaxID=1609095 RepID=UPI000AAB9456|nr:EamA family transporter [Streptomyces sp. NRRL F-4489]
MPPSPEVLSAEAEAGIGTRAGARGAVPGGTATARTQGRLLSVALVIGGIVSLQFGASVAVLLFPRAGAMGVVTLRLVVASLVLLVVCRPKVRGYARGDWATVVAFGVALAGMNALFYQAIDRIPLGAGVTLEFLGPLILSVATSRRLLSMLWAVLALGGVVLLGRAGFDGLNLVGVGYALAAGGLWAAYILLSARTGQRFPQADGLALAMTVAALLSLPLGAFSAGTALLDPVTVGLGAAVALMSSVLPYTLELLALRKLPASGFAVMMSLEPAAAATAGFLILGQSLGWPEVVAIGLVVVASAGAVLSGARR